MSPSKRSLIKNTFRNILTTIDIRLHPDEYAATGRVVDQKTYQALAPYFRGRLFRHVCFCDADDKPTEIDFVGVTPAGIYVFQSKNYSGQISGDGRRRQWHCSAGGTKYQFYSPIQRNQKHITALRQHLTTTRPRGTNISPDLAYFSVVIFGARCKLRVRNISNAVVVQRSSGRNQTLHRALKRIAAGCSAALTEQQQEQLCRLLRRAERPDEEF